MRATLKFLIGSICLVFIAGLIDGMPWTAALIVAVSVALFGLATLAIIFRVFEGVWPPMLSEG